MSTKKGIFRYGNLPAGKDSKVQVIKTGNAHFDGFVTRFGGLVRGSWMFLTGTAGAGKTTLILFLQSLLKGQKTILWSLEMSANSVERQCGSFAVKHGTAFIADSETCPTFEEFMALLKREKPDVIAIDSIQMVAALLADKMGEEKATIYVMNELRKFNEKNNSALIFIGQMNKDGSFNGPQKILQLADAHMEMTFYPDRNERVMSWGGKNRLGSNPTEIMYYKFVEGGMKFYSVAEWEIEKRNLTFAGFMMEAATKYLKAMKDRKEYPAVSKKLKKVEANLIKGCHSEDEFFFKMAGEINMAVNETWPSMN
jgi:predicted ATP-dependent serine protease